MTDTDIIPENVATTTFEELGVAAPIVEALANEGITHPCPCS